MITSTGALILLAPALPIALWAAGSDLKRMKIPNKAVLALAAVWPLLGWMAVTTWTAWFWGFALMVIVLVLGYLLYTTGTFGAGDAKYAAAMAPVFVGVSIGMLLKIIFVCMIAALLLHRIAGSIPAIRNLTPDWESWTQRRYFPFGLALSGILVFYLAVAFWSQA
ncbi:CpaA Flp pilus assembly protein, protease CpaA [Paracoccaceae bacterium]|jgi:prepilin peptidase CpaA